ncbi:MAG: ice-binding family protein, partial [Ginsengibacter sp.]
MKNQLLIIVTAVILLFSPFINFAQAPPLGTAAGFVLFSSNGAVTNGGVLSHLTGNVGNNIGALSGFGNVNGVMHNMDGASGQCAADLQLAYDSIERITANFFPVSPILGGGDTLTAGVYAIPGVATLDSILYLNGSGNSNAVFIFKIPGAFSTNPFAKVKLINGAQACNVFWRIDGAVNMDTAALIRGNVIAHDAIVMNAKDTLEGRALSIAGAVSVNGVLAYIPAGCGRAVLTGPVAPSFGTAGCFAIFSGNGSVINSGVSHVTGDVGTNVGLTVGYDELYVTGYVHPIPDDYTAAAQSNLLSL